MNTPVVWVLPEVLLRGFFWEVATGLFSYSASLGSTVDTCMALLGVVLRSLVSGSHLFVVGLAGGVQYVDYRVLRRIGYFSISIWAFFWLM